MSTSPLLLAKISLLQTTKGKTKMLKNHHYQFNELDQLAFDFGSDKGEKPVNNLSPKRYTKVYYEYFQPIRYDDLTILEIGIFDGASLKMWESFFLNAMIYGVDVNPKCKQYEEARIKVFIGSQNDKNFLQELTSSIGKSIDIIIDDGSHKTSDHKKSLEVLFPYLSPGGFYFIEDLHTAYWKSFGGGYKSRSSTIEYAKNLIDQINRHSIKSNFVFRKPGFSRIFDDIEFVMFSQSLLTIRKKF